MKPVIISFAAQLGNGKDEAANYLVTRLKGEWYRAALAENVKRIFCDAFGVNREFIEKWKRIDEAPPGFKIPIRRGLTMIGDGFRDVQENVWIDMLFKNNTKNLVISDCRYLNEANYIREHNGITVLLWRPGYENDVDNRSEQEIMPFVNKLKDHPDGEISDDSIPFDLWIKNDSDLDRFYHKIDTIVVPYIDKFLKA
jgi:hypothetical protein